MQEHSLGRVKFADRVRVTFPEDRCANCGTVAGVSVRPQDTRATTFLLLGGSEMRFELPIPACERCARSLARRPLSIANKGVVTLPVSSGLAAVALLATTLSDTEIPVLSASPFASAGVVGVAASLLWFSRHRAQPPQTSDYQPVRIGEVRRRFSDGLVERIGFVFTNKDYRRAFARANQDAVRAGGVQVGDA